jgi:hypothetical protein
LDIPGLVRDRYFRGGFANDGYAPFSGLAALEQILDHGEEVMPCLIVSRLVEAISYQTHLVFSCEED